MKFKTDLLLFGGFEQTAWTQNEKYCITTINFKCSNQKKTKKEKKKHSNKARKEIYVSFLH